MRSQELETIHTEGGSQGDVRQQKFSSHSPDLIKHKWNKWNGINEVEDLSKEERQLTGCGRTLFGPSSADLNDAYEIHPTI